MLRVGGEWVAPAEVEATIIEHPSVLEVAIVGELDDRGITRPVAYVVAKPGAAGDRGRGDRALSQPARRVQASLAGSCVMDELPKTATGKIQRFKLRQSA